MSGASPLPVDLGRWPNDPYDLLGVSNQAAPLEVRAAHDRLAAAFDPDRAPEQCRRLRAARDTVLRDLDLLSLLETPLTLELSPSPPRSAPPVEPELSEALSAAAPADAITSTLLSAPPPTMAGLWEMALYGREAEAYRGLVTLVRDDGPEALYVRLYWLLTALPDLDRERTPTEWLVRGLQACGLGGPLWALYSRLLAEDDAEALSGRCARLYEVPTDAARLLELTRLRWLAAARVQRWEVVAADLAELRQRLPASARLAWAQVWSAALDQLLWSDAKTAQTLASQCSQSLSGLQSVAPEVEELQRRAVRLRDLAAAWRRLRPEPDVPAPLLALIPLSWSRPFAEVRPKLQAFLAQALHAPRVLLRALDATFEQPAVLAQFARLLEQWQETLPPQPLEARSSSDLADLTFAYLDLADRSSYRSLRLGLFDFCLREAIAPEILAELAIENPYYWLAPDRHLAEAVAEDEPLRLAYLAHRLFWG